MNKILNWFNYLILFVNILLLIITIYSPENIRSWIVLLVFGIIIIGPIGYFSESNKKFYYSENYQ